MSGGPLSRRQFLERAQAAALALPVLTAAGPPAADPSRTLESLATRLLETWGEALLRFQVRTPRDPAFRGGLLCPACARIHGRVGDAVYPFLRLARTTGDARFLDAARDVFTWMTNVDRPDGSWVNDPFDGWRGTTVFGAIALAEALHHHGDLLPPAGRARMRERLAGAARFLDGFLTPTTGNVNYRMSAPLAFALAAEVLEEPRYRERARDFVAAVRGNFLPSGLLFGEGHPNDRVSPRGCRAVDLGYNVEESLPNLAAYAALVGDRDLLGLVTRSLRAHLDFLLPDGGWDNSWGTRNYKWTYWGSRTTDGASAALLLAGPGEPVFLEAALRTLQLLERCTHDGLLQGGPHLHHTGQRPCLHHTFAHAKMLAAILDRGVPRHQAGVPLPRQTAQGVRHYPDIDTWLVARGPWRATVTASDWQYVPEGNASGGALSLLWHDRAGVLVSASMTQYQMVEPHNQALHAGRTMTLTPAVEATAGSVAYRSLNDFRATVESREVADGFEVVSRGRLVARDQEPATPPVSYRLGYRVTDQAVQVRVRTEGGAGPVQFALPIVSARDEPVTRQENGIEIAKPGGIVRVTVSRPLRAFTTERVFNHVPGFQALALVIDLPPDEEAVFEIQIL
jgi:hypothetical protein